MIMRQHPAAPPWFLHNPKTEERRNAITDWLIDQSRNIWVRWPWNDIEGFMERFRQLFDNKCVYCEVRLDGIVQPKANLFRPYENARHERRDTAHADKHHYRWLTWEWSNLYLSCEGCANAKGAIFPTLERRRAALGSYGPDLSNEATLLLDPCNTEINPLAHLAFQEDGSVRAQPNTGSSVGAVTIEVFDLNRQPLVAARAAAAVELRQIWDSLMEALQVEATAEREAQVARLYTECADAAEFAGMKRQLLYRWQEEARRNKKTPLQPDATWRKFVAQLQQWNSQPQKRDVSPPPGPVRFEQGYALLIGIGTNKHHSVAPLPAAVNDALALKGILSDQQRCAYPADQIRVLHNEMATRQGILNGLAWLAQQTVRDDATAIIFFSGHGAWDTDNNKYYLLPHDYEHPKASQTALSAQEFHQALNAIPAKRVLVILDCCHAGGVGRGKTAVQVKSGSTNSLQTVAAPQELIQMLKEGEGRAIISSSRDREESLIKLGAKNSLFTSELIKALNGDAKTRAGDVATAEGQAVLRLFDLLTYLSEHVPARARELNAVQTPVFHAADLTNFPIALLRGGNTPGARRHRQGPATTIDDTRQSQVFLNTSKWRQLLREHFSMDELKDLCTDLKIDFEDLAGPRKTDKVRELIEYVLRHVRVEELLAECHRLRPHASWDMVIQPSPSKRGVGRKRKKEEVVESEPGH